MVGKTWVMLIGGLLVGFFAAVLLVPIFSPRFMAKPFGYNNNWGMGQDMMPNGYVAPNGSYSRVPAQDMPFMGPGMMRQNFMGPNYANRPNGNFDNPDQFTSNGQRIYFIASSESGTAIAARMMGMQMVDMNMGCAYCHGAKGQGETINTQMGTWKTPKISYQYLINDDHGQNMESTEKHEPYTQRTLKRAIVDGVNPDGEPLQFPMPRWDISSSDLSDLVGYLKELPK